MASASSSQKGRKMFFFLNTLSFFFYSIRTYTYCLYDVSICVNLCADGVCICMVCACVCIYVHVCVPMKWHMEGSCWHWLFSFNHFPILYFGAGSLPEPRACYSIWVRLTGQRTNGIYLSLWSPPLGMLGLQICTVHLFCLCAGNLNLGLMLAWQMRYPLTHLPRFFIIF